MTDTAASIRDEVVLALKGGCLVATLVLYFLSALFIFASIAWSVFLRD